MRRITTLRICYILFIFSILAYMYKPQFINLLDPNGQRVYTIGKAVIFSDDGNSLKYLRNGAQGLSNQEHDFTWTEGKDALFCINIDDRLSKQHVEFNLDAFPYLGGHLKYQCVTIYLNNVKIATWKINKRDIYKASIPPNIIHGKILHIKFTISDPTSPEEVGESTDARKLGIAICKIIITNK